VTVRGFRRAAILATLALTSLVASGCDYLFYGTPLVPGGSLDPEGSFDPEAPFKAIATYTSGTASLTIDAGAPIVLDRLSKGPHVFETMGADVSWTDGAGRFVRFSGIDQGTLDSFTSITLDWIADGRHWTVWDAYTACKVDVTSGPDAKGVVGTATCQGLRWSDAMAGMTSGFEPTYVEGQAPFDAVVTFEASS
jgi:hypothetical protein